MLFGVCSEFRILELSIREFGVSGFHGLGSLGLFVMFELAELNYKI